MKILFLTDNFPPEVNAPATRTYEHCVEWVRLGHNVTVITCFPNYPKGKVFDGYKNSFYKLELIEGIKVIRIWSYISENKGTIKRILDQLSFAFMAFWFGLFRRTDIIIATSPQFFITITGYVLSLFKRKPWVFELRDLWPDTIIAVGAIKNKSILTFLSKLEMFLYKKATLIIPVTDAFKENLIIRGINSDKIKVITNGSNLEHFKPRTKDQELLKKLNLQNKVIIGYIGTHGMTHGIDFILKCIQRYSNNKVHFLFIGDGSEKNNLIKIAEEMNLENVSFLPSVSKQDVVRYISIMDVSLVPLKDRPTFRTVIPSKIFELACMKKPILLGVAGQAQLIIEKFNAGICFQPENESDFLEKLDIIAFDIEKYAQYQRGCEKLAIDYDRKKLALKMIKYLKEVI